MKPIRVFTSSGVLMLVGSALCTLLLINALIGTIDSAIHGNIESLGSAAIGMTLFISFTALFAFGANRLMCSVWREGDRICRIGLFGGFYKEIAVKDIRHIFLRRMFKECDFIYLVDKSDGTFDRTRKDSYICFPKTEANIAFVRCFWDKEIEEVTI